MSTLVACRRWTTVTSSVVPRSLLAAAVPSILCVETSTPSSLGPGRHCSHQRTYRSLSRANLLRLCPARPSLLLLSHRDLYTSSPLFSSRNRSRSRINAQAEGGFGNEVSMLSSHERPTISAESPRVPWSVRHPELHWKRGREHRNVLSLLRWIPPATPPPCK